MTADVEEGSLSAKAKTSCDGQKVGEIEKFAYDLVLSEEQHVWRYPTLAIREDWPPNSRAMPDTYSDEERRDFFAFWRDVDHARLIVEHFLKPPDERNFPLPLSRVEDRMLFDRLERNRLAGLPISHERGLKSTVRQE